jgi:hypothetical protein
MKPIIVVAIARSDVKAGFMWFHTLRAYEPRFSSVITRLIIMDRVGLFEPTTSAMPRIERRTFHFSPGPLLVIWRSHATLITEDED